MKTVEDHAHKKGESVSHRLMEELSAESAGAKIDEFFEAKGLDYLARERTKKRVDLQAHRLAKEKNLPRGTFNRQGDQCGGITG